MAVSFYFLSSNMKMTRIPFFRFIHNTGSVMKVCGRGIFFRLKVNERGFLSVKMVFEYKRERGWTSGQSFPVSNLVEYPWAMVGKCVLLDTQQHVCDT